MKLPKRDLIHASECRYQTLKKCNYVFFSTFYQSTILALFLSNWFTFPSSPRSCLLFAAPPVSPVSVINLTDLRRENNPPLLDVALHDGKTRVNQRRVSSISLTFSLCLLSMLFRCVSLRVVRRKNQDTPRPLTLVHCYCFFLSLNVLCSLIIV